MIRSSIASLLFAISLSATTINVPADQATIQAGIDAAVNGDTVMVQAGVYYENLTFNTNGIVVASTYLLTGESSIISETVIDGDYANTSGTALWFNSNNSTTIDTTTQLSGFTIRNGNIGILMYYQADPKLSNLIIENCTASQGAGIYSEGSPIVEDVIVRNNSCDVGGGLSVNGDGIFRNLKIYGNEVTGNGGGVFINGGSPTFQNLLVYSNTAQFGGGIYNNGGNATFNGLTMNGNDAEGQGDGIYIQAGQINCINSILWNGIDDNIAFGSGTAEITYSDIQGSWEGLGNISLYPQFCDAASVNYHITDTSPCIGTGLNGENMGALGIGCTLPTNLVVNEIMNNPSAVSDTDGEWIELYNPNEESVNLLGWYLLDNGTDSIMIDQDIVIPALEYTVLGSNQNTEANGGVVISFQYSNFFLGNSDDEIILRNPDGVLVDEIVYDGGTLFPDPNGASMALLNPALDNSIGSNWAESSTFFGLGDFGTPGLPNFLSNIVIDPMLLEFDTVFVAESGVLSLTINNDGNAPLEIDSIYSTSALFEFSFTDSLIETTAELQITFTPTEFGEVSDILYISSNDPDDGLVEVPLSGFGYFLSPDIELESTSIDFGGVMDGLAGVETFHIYNVGEGVLDLDSIYCTEYFSVSEANGNVAPGESLSLEVSFLPDDETNFSGELIIVAGNDPDEDTLRVSISGVGTAQTPLMVLSDNDLYFGISSPEEVVTRQLTIYNTGILDLEIEELNLTGSDLFTTAFTDASVAPSDSAVIIFQFVSFEAINQAIGAATIVATGVEDQVIDLRAGYFGPAWTLPALSISGTTVILGGMVSDDSSQTYTDRGVIYSIADDDPQIDDDDVTQEEYGAGTGTFLKFVGSLFQNTTYYFRAYAASSEGISYGPVENFTTTYGSLGSAPGYASFSLVSNAYGKVYTWGSNQYGQLGNGSTVNETNVPAVVINNGSLSGRTVVAVAGGSDQSLALASDGTVHAWGRNDWGELGNGITGTSSNIPVAVITSGSLSGKTIISVAGGRNHALALASDGTVFTWGSNQRSQLGNGTTDIDSNVPVAVVSNGSLLGKTVVSVAAGGYHSLALASDGTVFTWGSNQYGQLGNSSTVTESGVPVEVSNNGSLSGKTVIAVACGSNHSLALASDGTIHAWGRNQYGTLGNGTTDMFSDVPVAVISSGSLLGKTVISVAAGGYHSLAFTSDSTLHAWGSNYYGQFGNGSNIPVEGSNVPVEVTNNGSLSGKTIKAMACGRNHSLVLALDGTVHAWGQNSLGQLGNGTNGSPENDSNIPIAVLNGDGTEFSLAINMLEQTSYHVAINGSDLFGNGTPESPLLTIQRAIDLSTFGDTVLVSAGTYLENINYNSKNIVIGSRFLTTQDTSYISATIIEGNQNGSVVTFNGDENSTAVLSGFSITNGWSEYGGGINCQSNPTLMNLQIFGNNATAGGGIYCTGSPTLLSLDIHNNHAQGGDDNVGDGGGGIYFEGSAAELINVKITNNSTGGGGIYPGGGGIYLQAGSSPSIIGSLIANNVGHGIFSIYGSSPSISHSAIVFNEGEAVFMEYGGNLDISSSIIWANTSEYQLYTESADSAIISYSDIQGGWEGEGNIDVDPQFCDPGEANYLLAETSPCIGSGIDGSDMGSYGIGCNAAVSIAVDMIPTSFSLQQNYPNPFNPSTTIRYGLPEEANVSLVIYDVRGQVVQTLESEHQPAGWYDVVWNGQTADGHTLSTGIYFARLVAGDYSQVIKMLYLK